MAYTKAMHPYSGDAYREISQHRLPGQAHHLRRRCVLLPEMRIERYLNIAFLAKHIISTVGASFYQIWKMCKKKRGGVHGSAPMVVIYCSSQFLFLFPPQSHLDLVFIDQIIASVETTTNTSSTQVRRCFAPSSPPRIPCPLVENIFQ
jgi:hypothetical protein